MNYTEQNYKEYVKYHFFIANDDIFNSPKAFCDLREWKNEMSITPEMETEMSKRMLEESNSGVTTCDLGILNEVEYISLMAMLGEIDSINIISYMKANELTELTLCNGLIIKGSALDNYYYYVLFDNDGSVDSIGLDLFLTLNKTQNNESYELVKAGK
jgi:hypothetical protein